MNIKFIKTTNSAYAVITPTGSDTFPERWVTVRKGDLACIPSEDKFSLSNKAVNAQFGDTAVTTAGYACFVVAPGSSSDITSISTTP